MTGKVLLNDRPLIIPPTIACAIGLNESVVLQQIHYWLQRSKHIRLNRKWVYMTYDELVKQIPFISKSTIRRAIAKLESLGYLISKNFNKLKIDKTKWYTINYESLEELNKKNEDTPIIEEELQTSDLLDHEENSGHKSEMLEANSFPIQDEQPSELALDIVEFELNRARPKIEPETSTSKDLHQCEVKENPFRFYEQNVFGTIGGFIANKIKTWCNALSNELVIEAMTVAVENSSRRWNYVEAILRDWKDKGCRTLNDVHAARIAYKQQRNYRNRKRPIREEYMPEWLHNREQNRKPEHHFTFEKDKTIMDEQTKGLREQGNSSPQEPAHVLSFEEKKRLFEERLTRNREA